MNKNVYLDYNATYPPAPRHLQQLVSLIGEVDCNPSSLHKQGRAAKREMEQCRGYIAQCIGVPKKQIIFTSGATESNNTIFRGVIDKSIEEKKVKPSVIISAIEHPSVSQIARFLRDQGYIDLRICPVTNEGVVLASELMKLIDDTTTIISIMTVNNEVGSINNVQELATRAKLINKNLIFHTDAVQALGKIDLQWVENSAIDALSLSGHKVGALKGIGILYLRDLGMVRPCFIGGGQERQLRSGTENLPGIFSFGLRAKEIAEKSNSEQVRRLRQKFVDGLNELRDVTIHSKEGVCVDHTVNCYFKGYSAPEVFLTLDRAGIAVSTGSACSSGKANPSSVLLAMGYSEEEAENSIRFSLSSDTTSEDIDYVLETLKQL